MSVASLTINLEDNFSDSSGSSGSSGSSTCAHFKVDYPQENVLLGTQVVFNVTSSTPSELSRVAIVKDSNIDRSLSSQHVYTSGTVTEILAINNLSVTLSDFPNRIVSATSATALVGSDSEGNLIRFLSSNRNVKNYLIINSKCAYFSETGFSELYGNIKVVYEKSHERREFLWDANSLGLNNFFVLYEGKVKGSFSITVEDADGNSGVACDSGVVSVNLLVVAENEDDLPVEGAKVYIDGLLVGVTDETGYVHFTKEVGVYSLRVKAPGYVDTIDDDIANDVINITCKDG